MIAGLRFRQLTAALLMLVGLAMLVRGIDFSVRNGVGWQGFVQSGVIGALVFALGLARWRFLRRG
jgi:hypothetical protein